MSQMQAYIFIRIR